MVKFYLILKGKSTETVSIFEFLAGQLELFSKITLSSP